MHEHVTNLTFKWVNENMFIKGRLFNYVCFFKFMHCAFVINLFSDLLGQLVFSLCVHWISVVLELLFVLSWSLICLWRNLRFVRHIYVVGHIHCIIVLGWFFYWEAHIIKLSEENRKTNISKMQLQCEISALNLLVTFSANFTALH